MKQKFTKVLLSLGFSLMVLVSFNTKSLACHAGGIDITQTVAVVDASNVLNLSVLLASPTDNCGACSFCIEAIIVESGCPGPGASPFVSAVQESSGTWNPTCNTGVNTLPVNFDPIPVCPGKTYDIYIEARRTCGGALLDNNSPGNWGGNDANYQNTQTIIGVTSPNAVPWQFEMTANVNDLGTCTSRGLVYDNDEVSGVSATGATNISVQCGSTINFDYNYDMLCSGFVWNTAVVEVYKDGILQVTTARAETSPALNWADPAPITAAHTYMFRLRGDPCHGQGPNEDFTFQVNPLTSTVGTIAFDQPMYGYNCPVTATIDNYNLFGCGPLDNIDIVGTNGSFAFVSGAPQGDVGVADGPRTVMAPNNGIWGTCAQNYSLELNGFNAACEAVSPTVSPVFLTQILVGAPSSESCLASGEVVIEYPVSGGFPACDPSQMYVVMTDVGAAVVSGAGSPATVTVTLPASTTPGTVVTMTVTDDGSGTVTCQTPSAQYTTGARPEPTVMGASGCSGALIELTASACIGTITWYDDMTTTTAAGTGTTFAPTETAPGTYTKYATCTSGNGCESDRVAVQFSIYEDPIASITCPSATIGKCSGEFFCMQNDDNINTSATSTGVFTGSAASFITGDQNPGGNASFDPNMMPVGVPLTLIYTVTSSDGCRNSTTCMFTIVNDSEAEAGGF